MSRPNIKETELRKFAELILTADDYSQVLQRLNGLRAGLTNRYTVETPTSKERINTLKKLIEVYK